MNIEILSIGDELLSGHVINSNAALISKKLFTSGYRVQRSRVVKDNIEEIHNALKDIFLEPTLLICTGGLGPTIDDITKQSFETFFDCRLILDFDLLKKLQQRFGNLSILENQATIIEGARLIENPIGTASGMIYSTEKGSIFFLPGVPHEVEAMLEEVLFAIEKAYPLSQIPLIKEISLSFVNEPQIDLIIRGLEKEFKQVKFGIYPYLGGVRIQFSSSSKSKEEVYQITKVIKEAFPSCFFFEENHAIEVAVHKELIKKQKKLAMAESCTGGALAFSITKQAGSSEYFLGSIVSYSDQMKHGILGVKQNTLETHGAVSKETVCEMLRGVFDHTEADFALATSGIAGPTGGTKDKPVGTVFIGVANREGEFDVGEIFFGGNRKDIVQYTVNMVLAILYQKLVFNKRFFDE